MDESFGWKVEWEISKYKADSIEIVQDQMIEPYEVLKEKGNLLLHQGAAAMWQFMLGNGSAGTDAYLSYYDATNSRIAVGTSTAAVAASQVDLQGGQIGSADVYRAYGTMQPGYPQHTDGTATANSTVEFVSVFESAEANFDWNEWGITNGTASTSRVLNRKTTYMGTKQPGETWTFIIRITLS
jgi:hypothetical protein